MTSKDVKSGIPLFKLFGFDVRLDWSWFFLAILITWTLAVGYFPVNFQGLNQETYWMMGIIGAIGLFLSIIFHEVCHSLVGLRYGLPITGIKLFIFGGVAEMSEMPPSPKAEFLMAIIGPIFSLALGSICLLLYQAGSTLLWPLWALGIIKYLGVINIVLGIFNMLPGFPLDGGRVLRSILWWLTGDLQWATLVAANGGIALGIILIFLGIFLLIQGDLIAGLWMMLIGFFLQTISKLSYQDMLIRNFFSGHLIDEYIKKEVISVGSNISVQKLVADYFYTYYHKLYPVTENGNLVGYISFNEIRQLPQEEWSSTEVKQIMQLCNDKNTIESNANVMDVINLMNTQQIGRIIVTKNGKLQGVIALKDLMNIIYIRMSLNK